MCLAAAVACVALYGWNALSTYEQACGACGGVVWRPPGYPVACVVRGVEVDPFADAGAR
jgi:hypothetical protein